MVEHECSDVELSRRGALSTANPFKACPPKYKRREAACHHQDPVASAAVHETADQLDRMVVDDQSSAPTLPAADDSAASQSAAAAPAAPPDEAAAAPPDGGVDSSGLTAEQQSVVEAISEMDSRCSATRTDGTLAQKNSAASQAECHRSRKPQTLACLGVLLTSRCPALLDPYVRKK